jgi:asparagine synthetase A
VIDDDLESLHAQMIEAWDQLEKLDASGETWDDFKNSFDEVWKNLQTVVDEVVDRYKQTSF